MAVSDDCILEDTYPRKNCFLKGEEVLVIQQVLHLTLINEVAF
ncbi:hypothetical protein MCO_00494 [Bartonella sp. DB5-6]|nr:hypothetical protein [Bartonella sp. DB5-6]EJF79917.1 hypothetical protein MCO_00494 [Bartonella sp. DB5-6]